MWSFFKNVVTSFFWGAAEGVAYDDLPSEESFATERLARMQSHLSQGGTVQSLCESLPNPSACLETLLSGREELPHGWNPTSVAILAVGGTVLTLATGYWIYQSIRSESTSGRTGQTYDAYPQPTTKDEFSGLGTTTSATTTEQGLEEFAAHFHNIIAQYDGVEGELKDKAPLEKALNELVHFMFWEKDCTTGTAVQNKMYQKLALVFHDDKAIKINEVDAKYKIDTADFLRFKELAGKNLDMVFKIMGTMKEHNSIEGGEKIACRSGGGLATALRENRDYAASLRPSSAKPNSTLV